MLRLVKKIHPSLIPAVHIILGYCYDVYKFIHTSSNFTIHKKRLQLEPVLLRQYHGIEKGLSFKKTRMGFGQPLVHALLENLSYYHVNFGYNNLVKICADILLEYYHYHKGYDNTHSLFLCKKIDELISKINEYDPNTVKKGGVKRIKKEDLFYSSQGFDFKSFSDSRYSIRDFNSDIPVSMEKIKDAIEIASKTPSACNRQAWKVHVFKNDKKEIILNCQNGNRGFRESIDTVLLITGLTSSYSYSERHGAWVDGGLFSMSLLLALHSLGLGTCSLNTGYTIKEEMKLRKAINLKINEEPIMMIAIGELHDEFTVANSARKNVEEIMVVA